MVRASFGSIIAASRVWLEGISMSLSLDPGAAADCLPPLPTSSPTVQPDRPLSPSSSSSSIASDSALPANSVQDDLFKPVTQVPSPFVEEGRDSVRDKADKQWKEADIDASAAADQAAAVKVVGNAASAVVSAVKDTVQAADEAEAAAINQRTAEREVPAVGPREAAIRGEVEAWGGNVNAAGVQDGASAGSSESNGDGDGNGDSDEDSDGDGERDGPSKKFKM